MKGPFNHILSITRRDTKKMLQHNNKNKNVCDMGNSKLLIKEMMLPL